MRNVNEISHLLAKKIIKKLVKVKILLELLYTEGNKDLI